MERGRALAIDTPQAITDAFDRPLFAVRSGNRYRTLLALREYPHTHTVYLFGETLHYTDVRSGAPLGQTQREVRAFLETRGFADVSVEHIPATIEDSFMARMGAPEGEHAA